MRRLGTPEEIADLAVHLAGATYTTGVAYVIDGGWVCCIESTNREGSQMKLLRLESRAESVLAW